MRWGIYEFYYVCWALLYEDDVLYAFAPLEELEYWMDESLLSAEEKEKMKNILEDDNPILICYKLE